MCFSLTLVFCEWPHKQGKKVCKATAVRCAYLFLFAGIAEKRFLTFLAVKSYLVEEQEEEEATVISC